MPSLLPIFFKYVSHLAVISALVKRCLLSTAWHNNFPFSVTTSLFLITWIYFFCFNASIILALVASVPIPSTSCKIFIASSSSTVLFAVFIAVKSVPSVKAFGGCVSFSTLLTSTSARSPMITSGNV